MKIGLARTDGQMRTILIDGAEAVVLPAAPTADDAVRDPAARVFLTEGDLLVTRISGLGELRNRVEAAPLGDHEAS